MAEQFHSSNLSSVGYLNPLYDEYLGIFINKNYDVRQNNSCISIEGAIKLACYIANNDDPFTKYMLNHKKKAEYIIKQSDRIGKLAQSENRFIILIRNFLTQITPNFVLERNLNKIQDFSL